MADNVLTPKYFKSYKRNVITYGNPIFTQNISKGFSDSNYIVTPNNFKPENNTFELNIKIKTPNEFTVRQRLLQSFTVDNAVTTIFWFCRGQF